MKNILITSFYFPPYNHPGIQRVLKFAKYLPLFGYHPVVLTCGNMPWDCYDFETYDSEVKDKIEVHKANAPRFGSLEHGLFSSRFMDKLILRLETFLFEDRLDWAVGARKEALELVRRRKVDLIYTTGPPQSVHFLGYYIKKKTGIPWVVDFRDPLIEHLPDWGLNKIHYFVKELKKRTLFPAYERMWLREASSVVTVTEPLAEDLRSSHPEAAKRITTITNGFDEQEFALTKAKRNDGKKFTILYTGRFWGKKTPIGFLEGLKIALERNSALRDELKVTFIGGNYSSYHIKLLASSKFRGVVEFLGSKSHREVVSYQLGSDANLLIISAAEKQGGGSIFSVKVFEYLRAGRPILAIVPKGIAWELIEKNRLGYTVHSKDNERIAQAILALYEKWKNKSLASFKPSKALLEQYERRNLTKKLSKVFDRCFN